MNKPLLFGLLPKKTEQQKFIYCIANKEVTHQKQFLFWAVFP